LAAAAIMGLFAWGSWQGLVWVFGEALHPVIACGIPIALGVVIYALAAVKFRAITREDCLLLPKGEKIANFLHF